MRKHQRIALFLCPALLVAASLNGSAPLRIQVSPAISRAPAQVTVRVSVEAAADNRTLRIVAESQDYYRSSEVLIDGKDAAPLQVFEFRNLPPGLYQITGLLGRTGGRTAMVSGLAKVEPAVGDGR